MGTINVSLPSDGTTADVADYNTPINTIVSEFNGNIDNANIKNAAAIATSKIAHDAGIVAGHVADSAITPAKLLAGAGSSWVWQSWTPTLSGRFNDAKWTKECEYVQIGKTVIFRFNVIASTTTPMDGGTSNAIFTLPVTAAAIPGTDTISPAGNAIMNDANGSVFLGSVLLGSTTTGIIYSNNVSGSNTIIAALSSAAPFTWTTSDEISVLGVYEAA